MRASRFFRLSSLAMIMFILAFLYTIYWVANSLSASQNTANTYQDIKSAIAIDFNRTLSNYLEKGDASLLTVANDQLDSIIHQSKVIEQKQLQSRITGLAVEFKALLSSTFRASGKLSGNLDALLINNESALVSINHQLALYVQQSSAIDDNQKLSYIIHLEQLSNELSHLIMSRARALKQGNEQTIALAIKDIQKSVEQLSNFAPLAIFEEVDEDELGFDEDEESVDLSVDAIDELQSLTTRYAAELSKTLSLYKQQQQSLTLLKTKITEFEQIIFDGEKAILTAQVSNKQNLLLITVILLGFLVLFLIVNHLLQHKIILRPLRLLRIV